MGPKHIRWIGLLTSLLFFLSACGTVNPYTQEKQVSKAAVGTGLGAATGAAIGLLTANSKNRQRNALIGAGIGALAGGGVGYYMNETNSADINASFYEVLNSVAIVLNEYNKTSVDVVGHTDSVGSDAHNQQLSEARARSVAEYLAGQKVVPERLLIAGRGESQPIAANDTPEGRAQNRRVTLQIIPVTQ